MDYQLIIFLSKKELMAVDITEDGDCEEVSIDGNASMSYSSVEDFADFKQYICDAYNVDEIEEMEAGATIVNCGADANSSIALQEELKGFKGIDAIDVKKLLPIVAQNKGIMKKGGKVLLKVMGNCFAVKCDDEGVATTSKNKLSDEAVELNGGDFAFLYFFRSEDSGISEEEIAKYQQELELVKKEAEARVAAAEQAAESEIAAMEAKYATIVKEHADYKRFVDDVVAEKQKNAGKFASLGMGDTVKFGKYYQDNTGTKKDIEWQVLDVEEKRVLLISKYGLDAVQFHPNPNTDKWASCNLRTWLNGVFFKTAFSGEEAKQIATTNVEASVSDKLFLLSVSEVNKYFTSNHVRKCKATDYAKANGASTDSGNCSWWLRSAGNNLSVPAFVKHCLSVAAFVKADGSVNIDGYPVNNTSICVRPALWVNL